MPESGNSGPLWGPGSFCQAALTVLRNLPTSSLRRLLTPDSICARREPVTRPIGLAGAALHVGDVS